MGLDGVDVGGSGRERLVDAVLACVLEQLLKEEVRAIGALALDQRGGQGVHPFTRFLRVQAVLQPSRNGSRDLPTCLSPCEGLWA